MRSAAAHASWGPVPAEIDLRPGGIFLTVMRGPDGTENDDTGCYLEAVAGYRLVFTSALGPGFRPQAADEFSFTTALEFEDTSGGTRYTERALHAGREDARKHSEMGFEVGWNAALDQLVALSDEIE